MRTRETLLTLIAELDADAAEITRLLDHNRRAWGRIEAGANDVLDWGALAFTVHTIYGVLENYFLRISKCFENNLSSERWHQELVEKMTLDIAGLRPALLTDTRSKQQVLTLVRFRHRFRNLYGEDLDPEKTREVQNTASEFFDRFAAIHAVFRSKLMAIADAL